MEKIKDDLQASMAQKFDKEFNDMSALLDKAYALGLEDGALKAKAEIINLISGGKHENKTDI
jgi:hypothetical protein